MLEKLRNYRSGTNSYISANYLNNYKIKIAFDEFLKSGTWGNTVL